MSDETLCVTSAFYATLRLLVRPNPLPLSRRERAKNDRLDARVLADFAASMQPAIRAVKTQQEWELDALMGSRTLLSDMLTQEKNRRGCAATKATRDDIAEHIEWLEDHIKELDEKIKERLACSALWQQKDKILQSVAGIGFVTSMSLLADCPELEQLNGHHSAKLVGVAPLNRDSGQERGSGDIMVAEPSCAASSTWQPWLPIAAIG